jgi:alkylated DNA repair dioxygenase AlkB
MESANQLGLGFGDAVDPMRSERIPVPDADLEFFPHLFSRQDGDSILTWLLAKTPWEQDSISYYGKRHKLPRLTCWFGDPGAHYTYSNIAKEPRPWTNLLLEIKQRVEIACQFHFNSVLLNFYRSGADTVSWHQDNERELGGEPTIASLSFGGERIFHMRHTTRIDLPRTDILLTHGSLLVMRGRTQEFWKHQIPRTAKPVGPRVNLTFRYIRRA